MTRKTITNDGTNPLYVGGFCIPPGETRVFEDADLPVHLRTTAVAPAPAPATPDPRLEMLELSVANFSRFLVENDEDGAPLASDEDLAFFRVAEADGKARQGIFRALDEVTVARAAADEALLSLLELPIEAFAAEIAETGEEDAPVYSPFQLTRLADACDGVDDRVEHLAAVTEEIRRRVEHLDTSPEDDG